MKSFLKLLLPVFIVLVFSVTSYSQERDSIHVIQHVSDSFTKHGIPDVFITLCDTNGIMVDTMRTHLLWESTDAYWGKKMARKPQTFLLKAEHPDYEPIVKRIVMDKPARLNEYEFPVLFMKRLMKETTLNELTVTATRVQIAYKGDTIVVDAQAFKIPEGSMLDALVASVPGAELRDDGTIYMNGRKVDYLTLNGKEFFKGKNRMMLDNLPYYVVNKLKFYEKDVPRSQMIHQDTNEKDYVMDVVLKQEYSIGYTANVEAGIGTDKRWLGRLFGLRFTDNSRLVIFANTNNTNETRKPGMDGWGNLSRMPMGEKELKMIGGSLNIDDKHGRFQENVEVSVNWTDNNDETRSTGETFISNSSVYNRAQNINFYNDFAISVSNKLNLKSIDLALTTNAHYDKQEGEGLSRSAYFAQDPLAHGSNIRVLDSLFAPSVNPMLQSISINKVLDEKKHNSQDYVIHQRIDWDKHLPWGDDLSLSFSGEYEKATKDNFSRYGLTYPAATQSDILQNRFMPFEHHGYSWDAQGFYRFNLLGNWHISIISKYRQQYNNTSSLLFRLEQLEEDMELGMLPSMKDYLQTIDRNNSYKSLYLTRTLRNGIAMQYNHHSERGDFLIVMSVPTVLKLESLRYSRSSVRNDVSQGNWYIEPYLWIRYIKGKTGIMKLFNRINFQYTVSTQTPDLTQKTGFTDTTNPLSVIRGNTSLKTSSNHHLEFLAETGGVCPYAHLKIETNIIDNMVANSFSYNPLTGIYTYRLLNVKGNWNTKISTLYRTYIDHGKYFRAEGRTSFNYVHNVDLATIEGFSTSQLSRVNHYITSQSAKVSYNKESLRLDAIGDFAWNVARRELDNVSEISAFDFSYGISGQYTLPWKIQLATDLKMYSRRGYEEPSMNTDELVWNASVSRPFLKGKLVVRVDGFDILNQLSSTRYIVNGQGRTETWQLCMSRYAMLRVAYKFNRNPKNK